VKKQTSTESKCLRNDATKNMKATFMGSTTINFEIYLAVKRMLTTVVSYMSYRLLVGRM
jgi:hypothetical protein